MKSHFYLISVLLIFVSFFQINAQLLVPNSNVTGVCYAGNKINKIYIPPPDAFFKKSGTKGGGTISVIYSGFSSQAKNAIDYAVSILETLLPADTRVVLSASYEKISVSGVLGNSNITGFAIGGGIDALNPWAYYPVTLAEKISGENLNDSTEADIELRINSSIPWYLGTDGNTPVQSYDLVTVVLHEICHGLGFFDSMDTDNSIGWYGYGSLPIIYDTFIENLSGKRLTDTLEFINYSALLRSELTGGQLYFNGPLLKNYTSGSRARIYAPAVWDPGSSVSHLDENLTLEPNTLMTPFIDKGEAIHNPGNYTFSILGDIGWINTRIIHKPLVDTENDLPEVLFSAEIKSDTLFNRDRVGVVYSFDNFSTSDTLFLSSPGSDNNFNVNVSIPSYNTELQYYFFVEDCFFRLYRSPSLYDSVKYKVYIGADTVKPVIDHTPKDYYLESVDTINFEATVIDNIGIDTVFIEYRINTGQSKTIGLKAGTADMYSAVLQASNESLTGGDSIQYRIFAIDSANVPNTAVLPDTGYFVIDIVDIGPPIERYSTDFSNSKNDFFNIGFNISKPNGFSRYGLHTKHPYESPEDNDKSIEYVSLLKNPIKFNNSGMFINFSEVVLVEPGETGSVFGDEGFYDYVIVEGSRNFGRTWFGLIDGYDSRYAKSWESAYNGSIVGNNSTFKGNESMLLKHSIFYKPSENLSDGDTVMLRFRLYSDPFANGWGWVIENLEINNLIDAVEKISSEPLIIYPNPGNGLIRISKDPEDMQITDPLRISVFNSMGTCVIKDYKSQDSEILIDLSGYPSGFYFILLYIDDGIKTIKYSLIK